MKLKPEVIDVLKVVGDDGVIIQGTHYKASIGKHEIWVPDLGLKIIWSINGRIESYRDWDKGRNADLIKSGKFISKVNGFEKEAKDSILNEYNLFILLSENGLAPKPQGIVYFKSVISKQPYGAEHCDPIGMYAIRLPDATKLDHGRFTQELFQELFVDTGKIILSEGAMGDVKKGSNEVNGYLIDVRRSLFDMMKINENEITTTIDWYKELPDEVSQEADKEGQFPVKRRRQKYQSYYSDGKYIEGSRDTLYRMDQLQIEKDLNAKTVLDLGCCHGAIAVESFKRGARKVTGLEYESAYVNVARRIARLNGFAINFLQFNLTDIEGLKTFVNSYYKEPVDIVFALSLYKHIPEHFEKMINAFPWRMAYVESNNAPDGLNTGHASELNRIVHAIPKSKVDIIGSTEDRSPRIIWRVTREI